MKPGYVLLLVSILLLSSAGVATGSNPLPWLNYMQFNSSGSVNTLSSATISSTITVSGFPQTTNNWQTWTAITLVLTHLHPENLEVYVIDPSGYGPMLGWKSKGGTVPCTSYFTTTFVDNQTESSADDAQNTAITCPPPTTLTPLQDGYARYSGGSVTPTAWGGGGSNTRPIQSSLGGDSINNVWTLYISDTSSGSTGTLSSCYIRLYCEKSPCFTTSNFAKFLQNFSTGTAGCTNNPCGAQNFSKISQREQWS